MKFGHKNENPDEIELIKNQFFIETWKNQSIYLCSMVEFHLFFVALLGFSLYIAVSLPM